MKLNLQLLSSWQHNENYNIALSAPMSPMLAAKDFIKKVFDKEQMVLTGLYRIRSEGEPTFTTWENADIEPVMIDAIVCILNFRHLAVFGEIGSRYMPIALILDGEAQFSELYTTYKWISAPTIAEITELLSTIDLKKLKSQFDEYRWSVKSEQADDWMLEQPLEKQLQILNEKIPRDALAKWDSLNSQEKYNLYRQWNQK